MSTEVKKIPQGYHTLTPSFTFKNSQKAIDFYKKAFHAKVVDLFPNPLGNGIMHATLQIGSSLLMMGDEMAHCKSAESLGACPVSFFLYVENADESFQQAVAAGCEVVMPVEDMFWGDRTGSLKDPFGYSWMIATHKQDFSKEHIRENALAFFARMEKK